MATYIIEGEASSLSMAECEYLGEILQKNLPDVSVVTVLKHPDEWRESIKQTCNAYGFKDELNPIIYTVEGQLIGDCTAFKTLLQVRYGVTSHDLSKDQIKKRSLQNLKEVSTDLLKRQRGDGIFEKWEKTLADCEGRGLITRMDGFFEPQIDEMMEFQVKYSQSLDPKNYSHLLSQAKIIQEDRFKQKIQEEKELRKLEEEAAAAALAEHEESESNLEISIIQRNKANPDASGDIEHEGGEGVEGVEIDPTQLKSPENGTIKSLSSARSPVLKKGGKSAPQSDAESSDEDGDDEDDEDEDGERKARNGTDGTKKTEQSRNSTREEEEVYTPEAVNIKLRSIPLSTELNLSKNLVVHSFRPDLHLCIHPRPLIAGQVSILREEVPQNAQEDDISRSIETIEVDSGIMSIKDTGVVISGRTTTVSQGAGIITGATENEEIEEQTGNPKITEEYDETITAFRIIVKEPTVESVVNIEYPLLDFEWEAWTQATHALGGLGFAQWLPSGTHGYLPLSTGITHVLPLPNDEIRERDLPIDLHIKRSAIGCMSDMEDDKIFEIEDFDFPNIVAVISCDTRPTKLMSLYAKCFRSLVENYGVTEAHGVNLLLTSHYMMIIPLVHPYLERDGASIYLHPLSYAGLQNLVILENLWPQTAGIDPDTRTPMALLSQSSDIPKPKLEEVTDIRPTEEEEEGEEEETEHQELTESS